MNKHHRLLLLLCNVLAKADAQLRDTWQSTPGCEGNHQYAYNPRTCYSLQPKVSRRVQAVPVVFHGFMRTSGPTHACCLGGTCPNANLSECQQANGGRVQDQ
eukprot:346254-Pelagomonas_calceolata.AAC.9